MLVHLITQLGLRMYWVFLDVLDVLRRLNSDAHKNLQHYTLFLYKYRWKAEVVSNEHNVRQKVWERTPQSTLFQDLILCVQLSHGNNGFGKMDFTKFWENAASLKFESKYTQSIVMYEFSVPEPAGTWSLWIHLADSARQSATSLSAVSCKILDVTWVICTLCECT